MYVGCVDDYVKMFYHMSLTLRRMFKCQMDC